MADGNFDSGEMDITTTQRRRDATRVRRMQLARRHARTDEELTVDRARDLEQQNARRQARTDEESEADRARNLARRQERTDEEIQADRVRGSALRARRRQSRNNCQSDSQEEDQTTARRPHWQERPVRISFVLPLFFVALII